MSVRILNRKVSYESVNSLSDSIIMWARGGLYRRPQRGDDGEGNAGGEMKSAD